jgi:hypothetical protein
MDLAATHVIEKAVNVDPAQLAVASITDFALDLHDALLHEILGGLHRNVA